MVEFKDDIFFPSTLRGEVEAFFSQALKSCSRGVPVEVWSPRLDVTEDDDLFTIEMDLPGVRREDVSIELEGGSLVIAGTRRIIRRTVASGFSHVERISGSFRRAIPLPGRVDRERVGATIEDGILIVELPKRRMGR